MKPYFLHDGNVQSGPFSLEEIEQKNISGDTLVWKAGMPDWLLASNVDELKSLFETNVTPPVYIHKPDIPDMGNATVAAGGVVDKAVVSKKVESVAENSKKKFLMIGGIIILLAAIGLFWFFKNSPEKEIKVPPVAVLDKDSIIVKEPVKTDTVAEIPMDSLTTLLNFDSTNGNAKKTDTTITQGGFTIGGMSTEREKIVAGGKETKKEKKKSPKPSPQNKQVDKPVQKERENQPKTVAIKSLIISGSFRKNLLLEAVMEGFIRNPNEQVSFHNITVTVTFINAEGVETGSKKFHQSGILPAEGNTSFKFKTNAPKGSKTVRYSVSATPVD